MERWKREGGLGGERAVLSSSEGEDVCISLVSAGLTHLKASPSRLSPVTGCVYNTEQVTNLARIRLGDGFVTGFILGLGLGLGLAPPATAPCLAADILLPFET